MELYRPAGLLASEKPDWTRQHGYSEKSEFPFPDLYWEEDLAKLAAEDGALASFLEACLERFVCHDYGHMSSLTLVENFLSRDVQHKNTWMLGNYPSEKWGEVRLEIFYDQGLLHLGEHVPRDLIREQMARERAGE